MHLNISKEGRSHGKCSYHTHPKNFGGDEYVCCLDCGDGFVGTRVQTHQIVKLNMCSTLYISSTHQKDVFLKKYDGKLKGFSLKKMQPVGKAVWHPKGHIRGKPWQSHCPPLVAAAVSSLIPLTAGWQYCFGPVARAQDVGEERAVPSFPSRALRVMRSKGWASAFLGLRSHTHVSVDCPACSWWRSRGMSLHKNHLLSWASLMGSGFPSPIPPQSPLPRDTGKYYWEKKIKKWWAQDICFSGFLSFFSSHF